MTPLSSVLKLPFEIYTTVKFYRVRRSKRDLREVHHRFSEIEISQ